MSRQQHDEFDLVVTNGILVSTVFCKTRIGINSWVFKGDSKRSLAGWS
jgi:hypothetical protein